ncbi:unnamed protein product [Calypogeia fissa]
MGNSDGVEPLKGDMRENLQQFRQWLEVNGVQLRGCTLKPCEENTEAGLGVYRTDGHPENGILMVTPLALAITPMTALQDPLLGPVFARLFEDEEVDDRLVVMLYLLVENLRGDDSFWAPYLKMLPSKFGMTLCFTEEELLELKGTSLYKATQIQQDGLRRHFYEQVKVLAEAILTTVGSVEREVQFEDFLWANCIFWTRALNVPFPQSFVIPKTLPTSVCSPTEEQDVVDGTAVVEGVQVDNEATNIVENSQRVALEHSPSTRQQGEGGLSRGDDLEEGALQDNFLAEDAVNSRNMDNHCDVRSLNQTLSDLGPEGECEPEATVWVECLIPGIDFCNHASQAVAVWEVDDQRGSTSGVQHSMYLVTGQGVELPSNTEIVINYGNKGNEELLYLYGFVLENNPDDYLMVHFPKEALEQGACLEERSLLLEEQKLPLRWLLPTSLLEVGYVNQPDIKASPSSDISKDNQHSNSYSWSGHRKPPHNLDRQVFPEEMLAALRIIAMTEEEVQSTTSLLAELSEPTSGRVPSAEDIRAAVWEVCGNAGALQLLQDLLTSKMLGMEEGTGSEDIDASLLEKDAQAQTEAAKKRQLGSAYVGDDEFIEKNLLSSNKRASVIYRKGQKHLVNVFLQEAEYALQSWLS